jgi:hypothetical protein
MTRDEVLHQFFRAINDDAEGGDTDDGGGGSTFYILKEDGSRILLENGTGAILLEAAP